MIELKKHYSIAKKKANLFMKSGNINAYVDALIEMNRYKKLMVAVSNN